MKKFIIGNWKMNPSGFNEAKRLFNSIGNGSKKVKGVEVIVCPPFTYLPLLKKYKEIKLGAQNCFWEKKGAFTGEISPLMLQDLGCKYVIIGHSERRNYFGETDQIINKKIKIVLKEKLFPIFCIGESLKEREKGKTSQILKLQIEKGLEGIKKNEVNSLILAYEPVWAIGTGNACLPNEAKVIGSYLRKILARLFSFSSSRKIPILYGGSVISENAKDYMSGGEFNGLLIGGASLNAREFINILKLVEKG